MKINVTQITEDPAIQLRGGLDMDRVTAMEEFVDAGGTLPPITVIGENNLLADGHHRLYVAERRKQIQIEANHQPGGRSEAIAIAITQNDMSGPQPLTRVQRNKGIKLLIEAGWTQTAIADTTGVHQTTVMGIHNALAMRGLVAKSEGSGNRKAVVALPREVHEKLSDTMLIRIASGVPIEQQLEFATAVAATSALTSNGEPISEPQVREAIKAMKARGLTPTEAVALYSPSRRWDPPKSQTDVVILIERHLGKWAEEQVTVDEHAYNLWDLLDLLVASSKPYGKHNLSLQLANLAVKFEAYASKLNTPTITPVVVREISA